MALGEICAVVRSAGHHGKIKAQQDEQNPDTERKHTVYYPAYYMAQ